MAQRVKLEKWTPGTGFQTRVQIIGDSMLVINWMIGIWKLVDHAHSALDEVRILAMHDCCDQFHQCCREWNTRADERGKRNGIILAILRRTTATIICCDGGVDGVGKQRKTQNSCRIWMVCADVRRNWPRSLVGDVAASVLCHVTKEELSHKRK